MSRTTVEKPKTPLGEFLVRYKPDFVSVCLSKTLDGHIPRMRVATYLLRLSEHLLQIMNAVWYLFIYRRSLRTEGARRGLAQG